MSALVTLTGVIPDESLPLAAGVPTNPRKQLSVPIGSDLTIRLQLLKRSGEVVKMSAGSVIMTVKKFPQDQTPTFPKMIGPADDGTSCDFAILPSNTKNAQPGLYVYDVWYTDPDSGARCAVVPLSPIYLDYAATTP